MDMKDFLKVTDLNRVLAYAETFPVAGTEAVPLGAVLGRVIAERVVSDVDLPDFARATMDGYAVRAASTFGASEGNPAFLSVKGTIAMGEAPRFKVAAGEAARISTGGMMPDGADAVVMIEHSDSLDATTIEVYRSVAPGQNMVSVGEDFARGEPALLPGRLIRPQDAGLLAAFGRDPVTVFKQPVVAVISTGDEIVATDQTPGRGQIRDINTHTLAGLIREAGGIPVCLGIVKDNLAQLEQACRNALSRSDMVLVSGGSSMGARDYTIEALASLPQAEILVHGIPISPGKPTILARSGEQPVWGLPGHVVSSMVVFKAVVEPFVHHLAGRSSAAVQRPAKAVLTRNVASAQGRTDYVRVALRDDGQSLRAEPILGKSALINTMVKADGMIAIGENTEGLDAGELVDVFLF